MDNKIIMLTTKNYLTYSVLAGAYKGKRASLKVTLTHSVEVDAEGVIASEDALCGQPNMCDYATEEEKALPPTCPKCLAKLAKLNK